MINKEINKILNIVSTDVGNLTTEVVTSKEVHIFESRLEKATDLKRLSGEQSFEMVNTGECFVVNKGEFENNSFKYDKDNFIQLLHYSIAMSMPSGNIKLATGIPAHQYNQFRDEMKNKIMMNNKINVKINNEKIVNIDVDIINSKIEDRNEAKKNKNYELADQIRNELLEMGIILKDTREGTTFEIKK